MEPPSSLPLKKTGALDTPCSGGFVVQASYEPAQEVKIAEKELQNAAVGAAAVLVLPLETVKLA